MGNTPLIVYDSVDSMTITIDPQVLGEAPVVLSDAGGSSLTFVDFKNDALFSDSTSYFDRFAFVDPANINITVQVIAWM
jgi:hypothetical protein